jgi:hypothetical protein
MDVVLFLRQPPFSQPMDLERIEAVCDSNSGTRARLWPTRGDPALERKIAALAVGATGDPESILGPKSAWGNLRTPYVKKYRRK